PWHPAGPAPHAPGQGHASDPRPRPRRRRLRGGRGGSDPADGPPARAPRGISSDLERRGGVEGVQVRGAHEEALRELMRFWQLAVPASADTSDGLTNFLWEQGALGVVEEELPGGPPRLLAFFPETASSSLLVGAVNAYRTSLRSLGFAVGSA